MHTKFFFIAIIIIMIGLGIGAYYEYKEHQEYLEKNECAEVSREDSYTVYNRTFGGSFTTYPPKIHYLCKDGTEYIK